MLVTREHLKRNKDHPCLGWKINGIYLGEHLPTIILPTTSKITYKFSSKRVLRVGYLLVTLGYAFESSVNLHVLVHFTALHY